MRYRLLKDLPGYHAGKLVEIMDNGDVMAVDNAGMVTSRILIPGGRQVGKLECSGEFDEWFKEVEEVKRWESQKGIMFYHLTGDGSVNHDIYADTPYRNRLVEIGNCFGTVGDAEAAAEKLKIIQRLRKDGLRAEKFSVSDKHITIDFSYSVEAINHSDDIYDDLNTLLFGEAAE